MTCECHGWGAAGRPRHDLCSGAAATTSACVQCVCAMCAMREREWARGVADEPLCPPPRPTPCRRFLNISGDGKHRAGSSAQQASPLAVNALGGGHSTTSAYGRRNGASRCLPARGALPRHRRLTPNHAGFALPALYAAHTPLALPTVLPPASSRGLPSPTLSSVSMVPVARTGSYDQRALLANRSRRTGGEGVKETSRMVVDHLKVRGARRAAGTRSLVAVAGWVSKARRRSLVTRCWALPPLSRRATSSSTST